MHDLKRKWGIAAVALMTMFAPQMVYSNINVIASFSILGDMAKNVGGDRITLRTVVGPDSDAHVYEPSPADAIAMSRADVILINGVQFEGFISRLIEASETRAPVAEVTKNADILRDPAGGHYHFNNGKAVFHAAPYDPHAWQSVSNAKVYVQNVVDAFCKVDTEGCSTYKNNGQVYTHKLNDLEIYIQQAIASIPVKNPTVVVGHNAFRYFEMHTGIHFLSPQGVSTESESSAADVAGILKEIKKNNARAVFSENISNSKLVEQIAAESNLKVSGVLYSDALSAENGPASTYLDMMKHNVDTIVSALGGRVSTN